MGMNDMKAVRHRYKQRYDFAASEVVGAFDELKSLLAQGRKGRNSDVERSTLSILENKIFEKSKYSFS